MILQQANINLSAITKMADYYKDFSEGLAPELIKSELPIKGVPFVGDAQAVTFAVTFDTRGKLCWRTNEIDVVYNIAVHIKLVSDEYLYSLQRKGISYIFAGSTEVDFIINYDIKYHMGNELNEGN
jgi:hypothetical protein